MEHLRIRLHKELSQVRERYMGFSIGQWISILCCAMITIPLYFLLLPVFGREISSWVVIFTGTPILLCGFLRIHHLNAIQFLLLLFRQTFQLSKTSDKRRKQYQDKKQKKTGKRKRRKEKNRLVTASKDVEGLNPNQKETDDISPKEELNLENAESQIIKTEEERNSGKVIQTRKVIPKNSEEKVDAFYPGSFFVEEVKLPERKERRESSSENVNEKELAYQRLKSVLKEK